MPKKPTVSYQLNAEQQAVVDAGSGVWAVHAGPGAGKSSVLIQRYLRLVREGVSPNDILSLSFTASAAKLLRDRAEAGCGVQIMDRVAGFFTFHSLALKFCDLERENFAFKLAEDFLCLEQQANRFAFDAGRRFEVDARKLRSYISLCKRNRVSPATAVKQAETEGKDEKLALAYKQYNREMREKGLLDFDSLVVEMDHLLATNADVLQRWQYAYIQTDESQDMDELQWWLIRSLSMKHDNVLSVGDGGQNLYDFRGSRADLFLDMGQIFSGVQTLYMGHNYRSTPQVVSLCKQFGPVAALAEKFHTTNPPGPDPVVTGYPSSADEAEAIVRAVQKMDLKKETCSVLARTNRALRPTEDAISNAGIPYHVLGSSGFWSQPEVKSAIAYLGLVVSFNDGNILTALRSPFHPSKFIRKTEVAAHIKKHQTDHQPSAYKLLSEYKNQAVQSFLSFCMGLTRYRGQPPAKALGSVLQDLRAWDVYEESADNSPKDNLQELVRVAGRFQDISEFISYTRRASAASKSRKGIALSTVHGAKGGEWDTVFLIAVQDGILPHAKAENLDGEKNVFFVGVSRAKTNLLISYAGQPSSFLKPLLTVQKMDEDVNAPSLHQQ